jgi:hypothetical protein
MAPFAGKLAPSAVVLAFVGYCVWPSMSELTATPGPPKPPAKLPELAPTLFSPPMPPCPTRNPWGGRDAATLAAMKKAAKASEEAVTLLADADTAETPGKTVDPLAGLKLDATCVLGDQRLAMINGQLYASQELLPPSGGSALRYKVVNVLPYTVVLEGRGKTLELTYSNVAPEPAASSPLADTSDKPGAKTPGAKKPHAASTTKPSHATTH